MQRWGCLGLIVGLFVGLALLLLFFTAAAGPPIAGPQPATIPPDVTIFISEHTLSRLATEQMGQTVAIDIEPEGVMQVTTRARLQYGTPVVQLGLHLAMDGSVATSRLRWLRLSFLTIPAVLLPADATAIATVVGETITRQIPSEFSLVGLDTDSSGITFQLKWIGPA